MIIAGFAWFGVPAFSIVAGLMVVTTIGAFIFGLCNWKNTSGKVTAILSGLILALLALVAFGVLLTVWSGSMG